MTDTANHLVPEQGKLRRAIAAVFAWIEAMDYSSVDYALDRIERLERGVRQLEEELRQSRDTGFLQPVTHSYSEYMLSIRAVYPDLCK